MIIRKLRRLFGRDALRLRKLLGKMDARYFLITSHGQTATLWLSAALNKHPDIFCTHGYDYPPIGAVEREYATAEGLKRTENTNMRFWELSLFQYFMELKEATTKPIIGNVHAFTYGRLVDLLPKYLSPKIEAPIIINMIRHPVSRIMSQFHCWISKEDENALVPFVENDFKNRSAHIQNYINDKYTIQYNARNITFIVSLLILEDITRDAMLAQNNGIDNICFEKLIADEQYFADVVRKIIPYVRKTHLSQMFNTGRINQHNTQNKVTAAEHYQQWEPWQRDAYHFISQRNGFQQFYADHGYEI